MKSGLWIVPVRFILRLPRISYINPRQFIQQLLEYFKQSGVQTNVTIPWAVRLVLLNARTRLTFAAVNVNDTGVPSLILEWTFSYGDMASQRSQCTLSLGKCLFLWVTYLWLFVPCASLFSLFYSPCPVIRWLMCRWGLGRDLRLIERSVPDLHYNRPGCQT